MLFFTGVATSPVFVGARRTLKTASSESFEAYVGGPKEGGKGVVLVHDWFVVSPFYKREGND